MKIQNNKQNLLEFVNGKKYQIVYADPPWEYKNKKTGGSMKSGSKNQYKTMCFEEILYLPINRISDKNSVLFLWSTVPLIQEALQAMEFWGFQYKTMITWQKVMSLGMGFWFRGQCEHLIFGIKGNIKAFRCQEPNFIQLKPLRHSEKPDEFRDLINRAARNMQPCNKIELFARKKVDGWDCWGDEIDL